MLRGHRSEISTGPMMVMVTEQFLEGSSLHGLLYLRRPTPQRLFWTFVLTLATALMVYYFMQFWSLTHEVLVMVENPHQDLEEIAFPAVTVCPAIKALKSKMHSIGEKFIDKVNFTQLENAVITMSLLKYPFYHLAQDFLESVHGDVTFLEDEDIINIMNMVKADLDDVVEDCQWRAQPYPCRKLFREQMTHEGYCFSFNSKTAYRSPTDPSDLPPVVGPNGRPEALRSRRHGANSGLGFRLKSLAGERLDGDPQPDMCSVAVHDAARPPDMALAISVPPNRPHLHASVDVSVSVVVVKTDNAVVYLPEKVQDTLGKRRFPPAWSHNKTIACACLPPCSFTTYNADFSEAPYSPRKEGAGTWVRVDYKGPGLKYARSARMNVRDVLVGSGSMASFLLGFSAVAVFDAAVYVAKLLYYSLLVTGPVGNVTRPSALHGQNKVVMFGSDQVYVHEYKDHTNIPIYPFVN